MKPAIEVSHLTKEYQLGALTSLRDGLRGLGARLQGRPLPPREPFKALDDVSFSVQPGEVVGVIGHNGAGKSTLLKMISRITTPTRGSVKVNGRIAPLIEVGAGFIGDFTGRENVYLNGAILGLKRADIDRKFDEIVAFAEMEKFIDTPVKRYSSGMQVKLAFAVATSIESEILIVDEVLAVGDVAFQRKSFERMESLIREGGRSMLLVSHNIRQIERICTRAVMLDRGKVVMDGRPTEVANKYFERLDQATSGSSGGHQSALVANSEWPDVHLLSVEHRSPIPGEAIMLHDEPAEVVFRFRALKPIQAPTFGIGIHTNDLLYVCSVDTDAGYRTDQIPEGEFQVTWRLNRVDVLPGPYQLRVGVASGEAMVFYVEGRLPFTVQSERLSRARANEMGFIELKAEATLWTESGGKRHGHGAQALEATRALG